MALRPYSPPTDLSTLVNTCFNMGETADTGEMREPGEKQRDNIVNGALHADTFREFEKYRVEHGLNSSEATRRLIRAGLDAQDQSKSPDVLAFGLYVGGIMGVVLGLDGSLGTPAFTLSAVCVVVGFALHQYGNHLLNQL